MLAVVLVALRAWRHHSVPATGYMSETYRARLAVKTEGAADLEDSLGTANRRPAERPAPRDPRDRRRSTAYTRVGEPKP
jgi:hypothetical protein